MLTDLWTSFCSWMNDVDNEFWGGVVFVALGFAANAVVTLVLYYAILHGVFGMQ